MIRGTPTAKLLIIGQAPGTRVHESGTPWDDRSGDRLREWLLLDKPAFYDESRIAIVPMGLCYPGRGKNGGDAPPRPECAPLWHPPVMDRLRSVGLTLLIGSYAQARYLGGRRKRTMTDTVQSWQDYLPRFLPLPHSSWRNTAWLRRNPWFERDVLPELQDRVKSLLG